MKRQTLTAVFAALLASVPVLAQPILYWDLPTTPVALSLGQGCLLISPEPEGLTVNPASLANLKWRTAKASGLQWWQDIYAGSFSGAVPVKPVGVASLSLGYWSFGTISALGPQGEPLGNFESKSVQWGAAVGRRILYGMSGGLALKGYSLMMPERKDWGWGLDLGLEYWRGMVTGTCLVRNVGPRFPVNNATRFDLPTAADLGLKAELLGRKASAGAVFTSTRGRKPVFTVAVEAKPLPFAAARFGYDNDDGKPERSPVGFGLSLQTFGAQDYLVEYGYRSYGALGDVHAVSLGISF